MHIYLATPKAHVLAQCALIFNPSVSKIDDIIIYLATTVYSVAVNFSHYPTEGNRLQVLF